MHLALAGAVSQAGGIHPLGYQHQAHAHLMQRIGIQQGIHQLFSLQKPRRHMHHKQAAAEIRHILQCGTDIHSG